MSILGSNSTSSYNSSNMPGQSSSPLFHEFKKQASFYIKEKIKTARLALTDVTPAQLMTEEATNGNPWAPDAKTMGLISKAAFEVDDYLRIVEILHGRLAKFDRKNWRPAYNALLVLEHLMTHGPESVAKEFQDEKSSIRKMQSFHHVDEKGFNWGLAVRKKSERILELLEREHLLKEERNRARKVTRGIQGFGSFSKRVSSSKQGVLQESRTTSMFGRSHSQFNEHGNQDDEENDNDSNILPSNDDNYIKGNLCRKAVEKPPLNPTMIHGIVGQDDVDNQLENLTLQRATAKENMAPLSSYAPREELHGWSSSATGDRNPLLQGGNGNAGTEEEDHPFSGTEKQSKLSLLGGCDQDL